MQVLEGWDAAERVLKGSSGREVVVDGVMLLVWKPLTEDADDALDLTYCGEGQTSAHEPLLGRDRSMDVGE